MPLRNDRKRREAETALCTHWEARQAAQEAGRRISSESHEN